MFGWRRRGEADGGDFGAGLHRSVEGDSMASPGGSELDLGLEIRTRSVEQTLVPLVTQVGNDRSAGVGSR